MLLRRRTGKRRISPIQLSIFLLLAISLLLFYYNTIWSADGYQAKKTVAEFYEYEQNGDYGSAWELFHSIMHERFTKDAYIQSKAQVFMQQLGAESFTFDVGKVSNIGTWSMSDQSIALQDVQRVNVRQHMLTVFGRLELDSEVFVVEEHGKWKLVWSYREY